MADTKITALTAITTVDPAVDVLPIVDVSDTTMAASGTTKKITSNQILGAGGTATLASATITGDLTVDTSTLKVDSANNRVGIVQAAPLYPLHLVGEFGLQEELPAGTGTKLRFIGDAAKYNFRLGKQLNVNNGFEITPSTAAGGTTFSNPVYTVTYDGIHTFLDGAGGTRMTLNSTGLGVGASPTDRLTVWGGSTTNGDARFNVGLNDNTSAALGTGAGLYLAGYTNGTAGAAIFASIKGIKENGTAGNTAGALVFTTLPNGASNVERMRIDSSGNLLVGVTSANANGGVLQLKSGITFPATQVASSDANTLDDYEEGTFTATLKGGTADPTTPVTTTGRYTKIGRLVSIQLYFNNVNTTGASGSISVSGLPFSSASSIYNSGSAVSGDMATFTGTLGCWLPPSSSTIDLISSVSNGSITGATHNAGASRYLAINIEYAV